jgi:ribonuclease HIII
VLAIGPERYNSLHGDMKNVNRVLAWGHARAIEEVLAVQECSLVISDQFADPAGLKRALFAKGRQVQLVSMVRAESDTAVAAASILARAEFLRRLAALSKMVGVELPKGATVVEGPARKVLEKGGMELLGKVAKLHFRTTQKVLSSLR